jgi:hypothetical protein
MSVLTTYVYSTSFLLPGFLELMAIIVQLCGAAPVYRLWDKYAWAACSGAGAHIQGIDCTLPPSLRANLHRLCFEPLTKLLRIIP